MFFPLPQLPPSYLHLPTYPTFCSLSFKNKNKNNNKKSLRQKFQNKTKKCIKQNKIKKMWSLFCIGHLLMLVGPALKYG